jgi:predicted class III extradiol MEMO1 family dioxygenase
MDYQGIHLIEKHDKEGFAKYLAETENTICGRNPIQLLMSILTHSKLKT